MAKMKIHYVLVKATFKKAVTVTQAMTEIRDLSALSYDTHNTGDWRGEDTQFKLRAVKVAHV